MELTGAACLVTGASSGIGRAVALRLASEGGRVVAAGRDADRLREVAESTVVADLAEADGWRRVAAAAGTIDVVVNNAGEGWAGAFAAIDEALARRLVATNLLAPILLSRALIPGMLERGRGHVVNVASIVAYTGARDEAVYAATKAGLVAFSESLRRELDGTGVGVSVISPGVVETPFFERRRRPYERRRPRPLPPERVADAVVEAIRTGKAEIFVPAWLGVAARVRGASPGLFRRLADRFD